MAGRFQSDADAGREAKILPATAELMHFSQEIMTTTTVRQATALDLSELVSLFDGYRQFYGQPSDVASAHAFLLERFKHAESIIFMAHQGSSPVGFAQLYPSFSSVSMARIFVLNDLFVHVNARSQGVSKKLIGAAVEFAKVIGAVRLTLSTAMTNTQAQAVYESSGWVRDEQFYNYELSI